MFGSSFLKLHEINNYLILDRFINNKTEGLHHTGAVIQILALSRFVDYKTMRLWEHELKACLLNHCGTMGVVDRYCQSGEEGTVKEMTGASCPTK